MTEKEFENLKEGDKVWIFLGKPKKTFVIAKQQDISSGILSVKVDDGGHHPTYVAEYVFLTKSEALEAEIKREEKIVENNERGIANAKERIARYKAERAKAKEEEAKKPMWAVDYASGEVWFSYAKNTGDLFPTEAEAYSALADYHKFMFEEALSKAGKINWIVVGESDPRIYTVFNAKEENGILVGADYDGYRFCPVCQNGLFSSRKKAEAESERRKKE